MLIFAFELINYLFVMENEATRLINDESIEKTEKQAQTIEQPATTQYKSAGRGKTVVAGAGGFVAGAAIGAAATAVASNSGESAELPMDTELKEDVATEVVLDVQTPETPSPEQAILANDEGIRYAHVEADNFNDAYAQARAQVGAGGVFEYNGKIYSTYTAEEWNEMTADERTAYQGRVFENTSVQTVSHTTSSESSHSATDVADQHSSAVYEEVPNADNTIPANAEMIAAEPVDNEIRVLGVEAVQNQDGQIMNVALVECEGDQALLVDVDNNGSIDVLLHDDNHDGYLQESEVYDVSEAGLEVADLMQAQAAQEGDMLYASYDDMPDYINDADSIINV